MCQILSAHMSRTHKWDKEQISKLPQKITKAASLTKSIRASEGWKSPSRDSRVSKISNSAKNRFKNTDVIQELAKARRNSKTCYSSERSAEMARMYKEKFQSQEDYSRAMLEKGQRSSRYYTRKDYEYNGIKYRSKWEIECAKHLDTYNIKYVYERLAIPYEYNSETHMYFPDFYLPEYNMLLEVKPKEKISEVSEIKRVATEKLGYKFRYVVREDLDNFRDLVLCDIV